jgi:hypothetical protein
MRIITPEDLTTFQEPRDLTPEEIKGALALSRAAFTAEDLRRYTELDEGICADDVIGAMEELEKQLTNSNHEPAWKRPGDPLSR